MARKNGTGQQKTGIIRFDLSLCPVFDFSLPDKMETSWKHVFQCPDIDIAFLVENIWQSVGWSHSFPAGEFAALLILREQVIKPVLAAVCRPKRGRPPKNLHPLDVHYQKLKVEMLATLKTLKLAA